MQICKEKTGWFYDQAFNRQALLKYVSGRSVLDVFSYRYNYIY
ncbi:MAG: hypothetical protein P8178_16600 [Candidatus Thiodiazotropha sp.]